METMNSSDQLTAIKDLVAAVSDLLGLTVGIDGQAARVMEHSETLASRVEELAARIDELESSDVSLSDRGGEIDTRITSLASRMLRMEELEKTLSRRLEELAKEDQFLDAHGGEVSRRVEKLEASVKDLAELRTQVNGLGAQVGSLGGDRHNTQALVEIYQKRIEEYVDRVKLHSDYIAELKTKQRTAEAAHLELIDAMSTRIGKLEEEITAWGARDS